MIGKLYYFNKPRGFGFIKANNFPNDVFVHVAHVDNPESMVVGATVTFDSVSASEKGYQALGAHVISENDGAEVENG